MVKYLVTTNLDVLKKASVGHNIIMVDGTVPGWFPTENDQHYDHHRPGGADIQIDEMPSYIEGIIPDKNDLIVTTQLDADAIVAAAYLQVGDLISSETLAKLRAIAYDCDHLGVPPELEKFSDFAAQCVAALKGSSNALIEKMGLPRDRKKWSRDQKEQYASLAFQQGTEAIIAACKGDRKFPGECGEADAYWEQVKRDTKMLIDEARISLYRGCVLINYKGLQGKYIDPRCAIMAYHQCFRNEYRCSLPITLAQREVFVEDKFKGYSYTLGCIPLHPKLSKLDYTKGTFEKLTQEERQINFTADPWGGRKTVGGSGWNTPSQLNPEKIIDIVLESLAI